MASWFGDSKNFPRIDLAMDVIAHGIPVAVGTVGDLGAALRYGSHSSYACTRAMFSAVFSTKCSSDVRSSVLGERPAESPAARVNPGCVGFPFEDTQYYGSDVSDVHAER